MNPPRRNPLDGAKYREQYLSNLRLQASNDQKNQNANIIFAKTGQSPARPPDYRTTTEKEGDLLGGKVDLRSRLSTITSGDYASQIIGQLDDAQIQFAINQWGQIESDMRRQFSRGVPAPAFVAYLNRLMAKFALTDGVETGLQQASGEAIIMSNTQILYGLPSSQIWSILRTLLDRINRQFDIPTDRLMTAIRDNQLLIPSPQEMGVINSLSPDAQAEIFKLANVLLQNIPSNATLADQVGQLNLTLANRDRRSAERQLTELAGIINVSDSALDIIGEIRSIIEEELGTRKGIEDEKSGGGGNSSSSATEGDELNVNPDKPPVSLEELFKGATEGSVQGQEPETPRGGVPRNYTDAEWAKLTRVKKAEFLNARLRANPELTIRDGTEIRGREKEYGESIQRKTNMVSKDFSNTRLDYAFEDYKGKTADGSQGSGLIKGKMSGRGLAKPTPAKIEKPYRQSILHLVDKPIEKPKPYTQFGRYYINKTRLHGEGIIAFRTPSGNTISTLPTEKVSRPLAKVFKSLVGGGVPSYEDINALSKDEKSKFARVCNTCRVDSPAIPKMKGEGEAEEDRFNILRGEIIAGNDNPKIAKEFKVMLLKLVADGRIPRRQATEILHELLALGH